MKLKLAKPPYEKEALKKSIEKTDENIRILEAEITKLEEHKRELEKYIAQHEVYEQAMAQFGE